MDNRAEVPLKTKNKPPHDPGILVLGIYLEKTKTLIRKDTCTPVLIAALFTIAKTRKQPKYPLSDDEGEVHTSSGITLVHKKRMK